MKSNFPSLKIQQGQALSPAVADCADRGHVDEAICLLGEHWRGYNEPVESEDPDVLVACGIVMSVGGQVAQVSGSQESAKNLYTRAIVQLPSGYLRDLATVGLAFAYWRSGEQNNGIAMLRQVLASDSTEIRFRAWFCQAVLQSDTDFEASLQSLETIAALVDQVSVALKGKFHGQRALCLEELADKTNDSELRDRAIVEYEAASVAFEEIDNVSREATITNNLAGLYSSVGQYARAHANVDRAISLFTRMGDKAQLALSCDQKARIHLKENRADSAERMAERAVKLLKKGDHATWLADCEATLKKAKEANQHSERESIRQALEATGGATSKAALLLGLTQPGLAFKIQNQYPELQSLRKQPRTITFRPIRKLKKK